MVKAALIFCGKIQDTVKLSADLDKRLENNENESFVLIFTQNSEDDVRIVESSKKFEVQFIAAPLLENDVDLVFKVKLKLDELDNVKCEFVVESSRMQVYEDICELLFPPVYNLSFSASNLVQCFSSTQIKNAESIVKTYLSRLPSTDKKPVVLYHSTLIPKFFLHGYSSRQGGISSYGGLTSLNLCYSLRKKDPRLVVMENRARLAAAVGFSSESFHLAKAVHGNDIWVYEKQEPDSYDGIICKTPNVVVAAPGADCNMLLFADPVSKSCGATHAGWKGILCGAAQATVDALVTHYGVNPKDLIVSIGPSLSACCCEFGEEQAKKFLSIDEKCVVWKEGHSKPFLNLRLAAKVLLQQCGVLPGNIDDGTNPGSELAVCTKCDPDERFYSFRRIGPQFGNQVGFIGLLP